MSATNVKSSSAALDQAHSAVVAAYEKILMYPLHSNGQADGYAELKKACAEWDDALVERLNKS
jgi:hypothetical protein